MISKKRKVGIVFVLPFIVIGWGIGFALYVIGDTANKNCSKTFRTLVNELAEKEN